MKLLMVVLILVLFASCMPQGGSDAQCGTNQKFNPQTRSCDLLSNQVANPSLSATYINEDSGPNTVYLTYSDVDNDKATSCDVISYSDGIDDNPPAGCTCTNGTCYTTVTPDSNFYGVAQFTYRVTDKDGASAGKVVSVVVNAVNDAPVAVDGSASTSETVSYNGNLALLVSDVDIANIFTYSVVTAPTHGSVVLNSGSGTYSYNPYDDDTTHSNNSDYFVYKVCDNGTPVLCDTAVIYVTVGWVNNAPVSGGNQSIIVSEGVAENFTLNAATDLEADTMTYTILSAPSHGVLSDPCNNTACTYDPTNPDPDYWGSDSFTYRVCDDLGACSAITTVTVSILSENDPPAFDGGTGDFSISVDEEVEEVITLTAATDPETATSQLSYEIVDWPDYGTLSDCQLTSGNHSCSYTSNTNFNGADSFTYRVTDGLDYSDTATVTITVDPINDDPTIDSIADVLVREGALAQSDSFTVDEGGDSYEDSQSVTISCTIVNDTRPEANLVIEASDIEIFYNGGSIGTCATTPTVGAGTDISANDFYLQVSTTIGQTGTTNITFNVEDQQGATATSSFDLKVPVIGAVHGGWKNISAIGAKVDKDDNEITAGPVVTLEWNAFTISGAYEYEGVSLSGWQIFRREHGSDYDYDTPHAEITTASTRIFSDTVNPPDKNKVYYYKVLPVVSAQYLVYPRESFSEVRLIAPPDNMAFVHRWMVNQEVCGKMHMTTTSDEENLASPLRKWSDPDHNYRCPYQGPGESLIGSYYYYDIGYDMLVDIAEAGCPFSDAYTAPGCGANGCVGIGNPNTLGVAPGYDGAVYYDRSSGSCYVYDDGSTSWLSFTSGNILATDALATQRVHLPPVVNITQAASRSICTKRTAIGVGAITGVASAITYKLPSRKESMAYSAWSSDLTDSEIDTKEIGLYLNSYSKCNSSSANGVDFGYTSASMPVSALMYSLPGTDASGIRSIYTGSVLLGTNKLTEECVSRYGVQDAIGNVAEWVTDRMDCTVGSYVCSGTAGLGTQNDFAVADPQFGTPAYYQFNGITGPCDDTDLDGDCDAYLEWMVFED